MVCVCVSVCLCVIACEGGFPTGHRGTVEQGYQHYSDNRPE